MKNNFLAALGITIMILGVLSALWYFTQTDPETVTTPETKQEESTFKLETTYMGDNKWTYKVTGELPNPCYKVSTEEIIMESYPEQVIINVEIETPEKGAMCVQQIQEYEYEGIFNASEQATVELKAQ